MRRLEAKGFKNLAGIAHGFFTREGGVSTGLYESLNCGPGSGDDTAAVAENRARVAAALGGRLASLSQIHSPFVHVAGADWNAAARPQGDGFVTAAPGLALGILTADCAPVLFADAEAGVIGAAHAGWKGALSGVLEATVAAMESLGARREHIIAAIGPAISAANYEVSGDFRARFLEADTAHARFFQPGRDGHWYFDLTGHAGALLAGMGLAHFEALNLCTYPEENGLFSFRRTTHRGEGDYGRQVSAILLTG
jgi:YfiH family protein